ncbi:tetratricopeptide repeat protein [Streptomyces sp. DSM 44915]|uniref:Tetratricopeptide repeat protein n=1 Tax=Streptomyces chisholmiae TaxID=3075540 RepID=A0ABU2JV94_9ACTN|nr:tetratricopeptide repeat protein [Streptomyces sp. DSM 44915]MDT0268674.1 tetratricopeptide repeat protein [Streptomyces sp. DSM 44915]
MRSHHWIAAARPTERDTLRAALALPPPLARVSAHRGLRGPYTAAGTLLRAIADDALRLRPELGPRHAIELQEAAPELADRVPRLTRAMLSSEPGVAPVARYPARQHSLRISHGLTDFLHGYLDALPDTPRTLIVDAVDHADPTDREFLAVLLRRMPAHRLTLVLHTGPELPVDPPGPVDASLLDAVARHCVPHTGAPADPPPAADAHPDPLAAARAHVAADGTDEDPTRAHHYASLPPEQRAALHDARAAELATVAATEPSLRLGALPYHLERGSDPHGAGLAALRHAQTHCKHLGLYQSAVAYGERGLRLVDPTAHPDTWWETIRDTAVALAAAGRADESKDLQDQARRTSVDPVVHMKLAYETAMLYARHFDADRRDPDQARAWVNQAIAFADQLPDPGERAFYSVFNRNGLALIETRVGRADEALRLLDDGIARLDRELHLGERSWHRTGLRYNRAQVNAMSGRLEAALADYAEVMASENDFADHYFNRGTILRRLGRPAEALADYQEALRLEPPFPEAYYNCADARLELGDTTGALADLERVLELDPDRMDARLNHASLLADLGEHAAATRSVEAGLGTAPDDPHLLTLHGRLLAEAGQPDEARGALDAALRLAPDLAEAWGLRAALAFEAGDLTAATADFDRALDLGDLPELRYNRGLVHEAAGRFPQAAADFAAYLATVDDPDARARHDACRRATEQAGV